MSQANSNAEFLALIEEKGMTDEVRKQMVEDFMAQQKAKLNKMLERKVERYETSLSAKNSVEKELMVRRLKLKALASRQKEIRDSMKKLRGELKELKAKRSAARKSKKVAQAE